MKKIILMMGLLFLVLFSVSALAAELKLTCSPATVKVGDKVNCDLAFTAPQSFMNLDTGLSIPPIFSDKKADITFSSLPSADFKGEYNAGALYKIIIYDDSTMGLPVVTKIGTITFTAANSGSGMITLNIKTIYNMDLGKVSLTSNTINSNEITVSPACVPSCTGKQCGADGCGGVCGTCPVGTSCDAQSKCACIPNCLGKTCGADGCGGVCGTCLTGSCTNGVCQEAAPTCTDNTQNQGETGIDCGGPCAACQQETLKVETTDQETYNLLTAIRDKLDALPDDASTLQKISAIASALKGIFQ